MAGKPSLLGARDFALRFDGTGGVEGVEPEAAMQAMTAETSSGERGPKKFHWFHCQVGGPLLDALHGAQAIDGIVFEQLSAEDTRPRCIAHEEGIVFNLRGQPVLADEQEFELVAVRMWLTHRGLVTAWRRPSGAMEDLLAEMGRGHCARTVGDLVSRLSLHIVASLETRVDELSDLIDALELDMIDDDHLERRRELSELRRAAISLRRYLYPQRDALSTLVIQHTDFLAEHDRSRVHDAHDRTVRFLEELESTRERCSILYDEIIESRSDKMNRQVLLLSIVSALFLPATLIAGILGMNVAGIPGSGSGSAFWIIVAMMSALILLELALFRWLKII